MDKHCPPPQSLAALPFPGRPRPGVAPWHSVLETCPAIGCVYARPLRCCVLLCSVWCQSPSLPKDSWAFPFGAYESRGHSHSWQVSAVIMGLRFSGMNPRCGGVGYRVSVFTQTATLSPRGQGSLDCQPRGRPAAACTLLVASKDLFFNLIF